MVAQTLAVLCFQFNCTVSFNSQGRTELFVIRRCYFANLHEIIDWNLSLLGLLCDYLVRWIDVALPGQVALLHEERNSLLAENDVLTDRANQLDTFDDLSTASGRKHSQLQQQLELLQEENFRFVLVRRHHHNLHLVLKAWVNL